MATLLGCFMSVTSQSSLFVIHPLRDFAGELSLRVFLFAAPENERKL